MKKIIYLILALSIGSMLQGQTITVTAPLDLAEWDFIYIIDAQKSFGPGNSTLFNYRIDPGENSVQNLKFKISLKAYAPALELDDPTLFDVEFSLDLVAPLTISNTNLHENVVDEGIADELGNIVEFAQFHYEGISGAKSSDLLLKMIDGELPEGTYTFDLNIEAPSGYSVEYVGFNPNKVITIVKPESFTIVSPRDEEQIGGTNPFFQWTSQGCDDYYLRICEYNPLLHSSFDDAINSESSLPYPDNQDFYSLGSASTFQYSDQVGRSLEIGKTYVWQVKKICHSNSADKEMYSIVSSFSILDSGGQTETPCQQQLRNVLGDSQYNILFGANGPLEGYGVCAEITLDGATVSPTIFAALLVQLMNGVYEIESITTQ